MPCWSASSAPTSMCSGRNGPAFHSTNTTRRTKRRFPSGAWARPRSSPISPASWCRSRAAISRVRRSTSTAGVRLWCEEVVVALRVVQEIESESQKLADVDVDVIIFPATAPSSRNGPGYDQELIKRISAASGKPATTASTALLEALRALSVKQIALGAPWSASVNQSVAAFLEANGVKVLAQEALGLVRNLEIGLLDPQTAFDVGRRVDRSEADAVMLACGNWSTFGIVDRLERDLRKPVLTT